MDFARKFFKGVRKVINESLVDEPNVQIGKMPNDRFSTFDDFFKNDLKCFGSLLHHLILLIVFKSLHVLLNSFAGLLFEELLFLWSKSAVILVPLHLLFAFIKQQLVFATKVIEYSFCPEVDLHRLFIFEFLIDLFDKGLVLLAKVDFGRVQFVCKRVKIGLWLLLPIDSFELQAVLEDLAEIEVVSGQKGGTLPLRDQNFVETFLGSG